jgi:hypothetical protein
MQAIMLWFDHHVDSAENGEGNINFMVKTDFDAPEVSLLDPVEKVNPSNETIISAYVEEQFNLETVTLNYTKDNWATSTALEMFASQNQTYTGTIPAQAAGTVVNYTVLARDISGNSAEVMGSYEVKNTANITLELEVSCLLWPKHHGRRFNSARWNECDVDLYDCEFFVKG